MKGRDILLPRWFNSQFEKGRQYKLQSYAKLYYSKEVGVVMTRRCHLYTQPSSLGHKCSRTGPITSPRRKDTLLSSNSPKTSSLDSLVGWEVKCLSFDYASLRLTNGSCLPLNNYLVRCQDTGFRHMKWQHWSRRIIFYTLVLLGLCMVGVERVDVIRILPGHGSCHGRRKIKVFTLFTSWKHFHIKKFVLLI